MKEYIICKSSRGFTGVPYAGAACVAIGIERGRTYTDLKEAMRDAIDLTGANPVGFEVYELATGEQVLNTTVYRLAPSMMGPLCGTWADKPHRLIYDLCNELDRLRGLSPEH